MPKRPATDNSPLSCSFEDYGEHKFLLNKHIRPDVLKSLVWENGIDGTTCMDIDEESYAAYPVIFLAYGRIVGDDISFNLTPDGGWQGDSARYPRTIQKHKLRGQLMRPARTDQLDGIDLHASWDAVTSNIKILCDARKKSTHPLTGPFSVDKLDQEILNFQHSLFRSPRVLARSADDLYAPISSYQHPSLSIVGWPWPSDGPAVKLRDELIRQNLKISPLPSYDYESEMLILPERYNDLRDALVVLHFNLVWNYFKNEDKDNFSVVVRRIDVLDDSNTSGQFHGPSPSKKCRTWAASPSPPHFQPLFVPSDGADDVDEYTERSSSQKLPSITDNDDDVGEIGTRRHSTKTRRAATGTSRATRNKKSAVTPVTKDVSHDDKDDAITLA